MTKVVAYIPIKEKSERVPNKNIRDINGKPLFYWVLNTLYQSKNIDKIIVDTDTNFMREKISSFFPNIEIIMRPKHLMGGAITGDDLVKNSLPLFDDDDIIFLTHVTNPLLKAQTIDKAIDAFKNNDCDHLLSVIIHNSRFYYQNKPLNHDITNMQNTQDLEPVIEENSNIFIFTKHSFEKYQSRIGRKPYLFPMSVFETSDIDYEEDWQWTKFIMENADYKKLL